MILLQLDFYSLAILKAPPMLSTAWTVLACWMRAQQPQQYTVRQSVTAPPFNIYQFDVRTVIVYDFGREKNLHLHHWLLWPFYDFGKGNTSSSMGQTLIEFPSSSWFALLLQQYDLKLRLSHHSESKVEWSEFITQRSNWTQGVNRLLYRRFGNFSWFWQGPIEFGAWIPNHSFLETYRIRRRDSSSQEDKWSCC